jgi:hypothetical protein
MTGVNAGNGEKDKFVIQFSFRFFPQPARTSNQKYFSSAKFLVDLPISILRLLPNQQITTRGLPIPFGFVVIKAFYFAILFLPAE